MSLNWDTTRVKYFKDNPDELYVKLKDGDREYEDVNVITKSLIFGSMAVGFGQISYATAPLWYARWKVFEKYDNFYLYSTFDGNESIKTFLTPDVIRRHMGLHTNVSDESDTKWVQRMAKAYARDNKDVSVQEIKKTLKEFKEEYENFGI